MDYSVKYEIFGYLLEYGKVCEDDNFDFSSACRILDVDPEDFSDYIFSQVGMTGNEVISLYKGYCI